MSSFRAIPIDSTPYNAPKSRPSLEPRAPQGPSDEQLNRIPLDPMLPPFGGSGSLFADLVTGPLMDSGRATSVMMIGDRVKTSTGLQTVRKY